MYDPIKCLPCHYSIYLFILFTEKSTQVRSYVVDLFRLLFRSILLVIAAEFQCHDRVRYDQNYMVLQDVFNKLHISKVL